MIDRTNAFLKKNGFQFKPFRVPEEGIQLNRSHLPGDLELIVFERSSQHRALLMSEMAYHHVAQGEITGIPYLISF